ncbi:sulfotransferase family protein [Stenomitos frigidus]|uniref:Chromosome partitioning protein ParA n=1 Tax=Stenomitos frigidus ULC18 TaxID=2107698 RepID=A0A2T1DTH4_9CYAN|nr:sulfotransferase [Stenomitos frigidus]PSB23803.1 chromosome partitioning protein ParA [Stenomitos frigidus ULC18]
MQTTEKNQQPILIIAGMHRSGTSLTTALLQSAGLDIGQSLLEESSSNVKGHFENLNFLNFHREALGSIGLNNDGWTVANTINVPEYYVDQARILIRDNASSTQPWGWKDPRTTLFLNFWENLLPDAKFLLVYRSPWEVIDSIYRRGDVTFRQNPEFALAIWMNYNQLVLDFYQRFSEKCLLIHLKQIVDRPTAFVELLSQHLSMPLSSPKEEIYDASLLKTQALQSQRALLIQRYFPNPYALYQQLNEAAAFEDAAVQINQELISPTAWLLKDWLDLRGLSNQVTALQSQLSSSQAELANIAQERQQLQAANQALQDINQTLQKDFSTCVESRNQLKDQFHQQLEQTHAAIAAMKTSKFWKLRTQWIQLKQRFHLKE